MNTKKILSVLLLTLLISLPLSTAFAREQGFEFSLYYQGGPEVEHTSPERKPDAEPALYAYLTYINYNGSFVDEYFTIWAEKKVLFYTTLSNSTTVHGLYNPAYTFYRDGGGVMQGKFIGMGIKRQGKVLRDKTIGVGGKFEP